MRYKIAKVSALVAVVVLAAVTAWGREAETSKPAKAQNGASRAPWITKDSAGPVHLGMTVAQARKAMPGVKFARTIGSDGVALIELTRGEAPELMLYAGEADPEKPIDEKAKIEMISVWGPTYQTVEGVHPGMRLGEVEKKYGKLIKITKSEIESHEYAEFTRQPAGLQFRIGLPEIGLVGTYSEGSQETRVYARSAVVTSIEIYK